jgi:hypothetical protein
MVKMIHQKRKRRAVQSTVAARVHTVEQTRSSRSQRKKREEAVRESQEEIRRELQRELEEDIILLQRLDDDRHTLLHYAVYWERSTMVRILCELAQQSGLLEEVLLAKDSQVCVAMDLAWIARDPSILSYLQNQHQLLQIQFERTRLLPALSKATRRLWEGFRTTRFDLLTVINTFLVYRMGRFCFSFHWTIACLGIAIFQSPRYFWTLLQEHTKATHDSAAHTTNSAPFLSFFACSKVTWSFFLCWIYAHGFSYFLLWIGWESFLIVTPVVVLCGCCRIVDFVELPVFVWSWASVTFIYYPFQISEQALLKWISGGDIRPFFENAPVWRRP